MNISIQGDKFYMDGKLTYSDFPGARPEALGRLMNSRMVQATFDDENPETVKLFSYPDGSPFDPDRQTNEFIAMLPEYRKYGVIAFTVNFQGGYPQYHVHLRRDQILQNWDNNAFAPNGRLKWRYAERMKRVIEAADANRMAVIVGFFYFGQNHKLQDEAAVRRAVTEATEFLVSLKRGNVMIEINNECEIGYVHPLLQPHGVHQMINLAREVCKGQFPISTSYGGGTLPGTNVLDAADYILIHGNGQTPERIRQMVRGCKAMTDKPVVFNEDSVRVDNCRAAFEEGASWGYYDQGGRTPYADGFQSVPTNWAINTPEKQAFFNTVAELVGMKTQG
jgi:hypothetical protein